MRRPADATVAQLGRVTAHEIAVELGMRPGQVRKLLDKHGWWIGDGRRVVSRHKPTTYDASVIDKLTALLGHGHRQLEEPADDWLSRYIGGTNA